MTTKATEYVVTTSEMGLDYSYIPQNHSLYTFMTLSSALLATLLPLILLYYGAMKARSF